MNGMDKKAMQDLCMNMCIVHADFYIPETYSYEITKRKREKITIALNFIWIFPTSLINEYHRYMKIPSSMVCIGKRL